MSKAVLLSIKPRWCALIASGKKTIEVRKTCPQLKTPFRCYIYQTKNGKVIGEFTCDKTIMSIVGYKDHVPAYWDLIDGSCLTADQLMDYGKWKVLYGWHISNLVTHDKPKELSEFITPSKFGCVNEGKCRGCVHLDRGNGYSVEDDCTAWFSTDDYKPLRKAPQSWCYVEELEAKTWE